MKAPGRRGKPSLLEAGLPCASLSAECQRDNNARQRPPQNRLHIWWARRPPTVCRAAILGALLPHDLEIADDLLPAIIPEPTGDDLENLPRRLDHNREVLKRILLETKQTHSTKSHQTFLRTLGITGDAAAAQARMALRDELSLGGERIELPNALVYRHEPAFAVSPSVSLLEAEVSKARELLGEQDRDIVVLDSMAGGGTIPLEGVRYGFKVHCNELNPVASVTLKATLEYPSRYGSGLTGSILKYSEIIAKCSRERLEGFFYAEPAGS
jgi:adenine-specific DNA methylase